MRQPYQYVKIGLYMAGNNQFAVNREGVAERAPIGDVCAPASFFSYNEFTREQFVVASDGTVNEEHLVVPGIKGAFEAGVVMRTEETGVWLIDPNTPGVEPDEHTYFMDTEGRVVEISTGIQVTCGDGRFELRTGVIQRYEAESQFTETI